jgi:hypothetical protein
MVPGNGDHRCIFRVDRLSKGLLSQADVKNLFTAGAWLARCLDKVSPLRPNSG